MNRHTKYAKFLMTVMDWLDTEFLQSRSLHYARKLLEKYLLVLRTRGKREAIRFCKERRASIYQWISSIDSLDDPVRCKSSVVLPKDLRFLKHFKKLDYPDLRLILTSLYASRGLELPPTINVETITSASKTELPEDIGFYIDEFWDALGYRHRRLIPKSVYWRKFHLTTKTGPNGQALWSSIADLSVLPPDLIRDIGIVGGNLLLSKMELLRRYLHLFVPVFKVIGTRFRKVSAIPSQEGKTREVAILDYWSQSALRGLHRYLFGVLRRIPQDCTFNQGGFKDKINWEDGGHSFHSVDLTAATDRFPIQLICQILKGRFTDEYVNSWHNIMVGHPFWTPTGNINYAVGNPMGAYSSWNSFALAHHYVVYYCCRKLGVNWRDAPYVILGDDIVIKHNEIAKEYMKVMTRLGVEFSSQKTHISPNMMEFAKRIFHKGNEITPFPISALWSSRKTPSLMLNVLVNEVSKGWTSPLGTPIVLSEIYRYLGFNATYVAKKAKIFLISHQIMMGMSGRATAEEALTPILVKYYPQLLKSFKDNFVPMSEMAEYWLHKILIESMSSSVSSLSKPGKPLGLIAEQLVCFITGRDDTIIDAFDLILALPVLQVHGQVEETYMKVLKGKKEQFILGLKGDWKSMLRTLTIPISDEIYVSRNQELMVHASFTLGKILRGILENEAADYAAKLESPSIFEIPPKKKFSGNFDDFPVLTKDNPFGFSI